MNVERVNLTANMTVNVELYNSRWELDEVRTISVGPGLKASK